MFRSDFWDGLPPELTVLILTYLSPETICSLAYLNKQFRILAKDNTVWSDVYKRQFPSKVETLIRKKDIHWHSEFRHDYDVQYGSINKKIKKLFSLVKDNDLPEFLRFPIQANDLDHKDLQQKSLLEWAQTKSHQRFLDYFYQIILSEYKHSDNTINTKKKDRNGRTIFYWAIACHQPLATIHSLQAQGSSMNELYFKHVKPIHIAAEQGLLNIVNDFITTDPNLLEQPDSLCQTPLLSACYGGKTQLINFFILKGAHLNVAIKSEEDDNGETALHILANHTHEEMAKLLINAGADIHIVASKTKKHPIHIAAEKGLSELTALLLERDSELLEIKDSAGRTPLFFACKTGQLSVAKLLIHKKANANVIEHIPNNKENGKTPLWVAAQNGFAAIVQLLINAGATLNHSIDDLHYQAIHVAAENGHLDVVAVLGKACPSLLEAATAANQTPLTLAAKNNHKDLVTFLIREKVYLNPVTCFQPDFEDWGKTPLYFAVEKGLIDTVNLLLEAGAVTDIPPQKDRDKPIIIAAKKGYTQIVKAFIESNPKLIEQCDEANQTPLIWASANNHVETVNYLIQQKANLEAMTQLPGSCDHGNTSLYWAIENCHSKVVIVLLKAGALLKHQKPIPPYFSILNNEAQNLLQVEIYRLNREEDDREYKRSLTLFGYTKTLGSSKQRKLEAVKEIKNVHFFGKDPARLKEYEYEIGNGQLATIYKPFKK